MPSLAWTIGICHLVDKPNHEITKLTLLLAMNESILHLPSFETNVPQSQMPHAVENLIFGCLYSTIWSCPLCLDQVELCIIKCFLPLTNPQSWVADPMSSSVPLRLDLLLCGSLPLLWVLCHHFVQPGIEMGVHRPSPAHRCAMQQLLQRLLVVKLKTPEITTMA